MALAALVLAPPRAEERVVTGLTLAERARRVAMLAGVAQDDVHLVRDAAALAGVAGALAGRAVLIVDAVDHVVAQPLVVPLVEAARAGGPTGDAVHVAEDPAAGGAFAGAVLVPASQSAACLAALTASADLAAARAALAAWVAAAPHATRHAVTRRARHAARTRDDLAAADRWQFELVDKPLDAAITRYFYRLLARPLTRVFLRLPFSPNHITIFSATLSLVGCFIAAGPSYGAHVLGLALLVLGGIVDCNDGEVARLRLEFSTMGGWLDAIGDDLARLSLLIAMGLHVAPRLPDVPVMWITGGALVLTVAAMLLIYWYCIFVIRSSNNQEYGAALGVGDAATTKRSVGRAVGDFFAHIARRDSMDLITLVLAVFALPVIPWLGMIAGAILGFAWVLPTHLRLVRQRREAAQRASVA